MGVERSIRKPDGFTDRFHFISQLNHLQILTANHWQNFVILVLINTEIRLAFIREEVSGKRWVKWMRGATRLMVVITL